VEQLEDPENWARLKTERTLVRLSKLNVAWIVKTERETGLANHNDVVTFWRENANRATVVLVGNWKVVFDGDVPIAVVGPSGCGKTLFIKLQVLPFAPGPVIVVDVPHEYDKLRKVTLSDLIGLKWGKCDKSTRIRFCPNPNPELSKVELDMLFAFLNTTKQEHFKPGVFPSGNLSAWTVVLEESHRLRHSENATNFVLESRKYVRKLVSVTSDASMYASVCRLVKPPPLEQLLNYKTQGTE
jgi:hypothetical protein